MTGAGRDSLTVAVIDHRFPSLDEERAVLAPLGAGLIDLRGQDPEAVMAAAAGADGILVGARFRLDLARLLTLRRCRVIARYGVGTDNVDVAAASRLGIAVTCVPDYCVEEVSTHAMALLLALHRRLFQFDRAVREGAWGIGGEHVARLSEATLGIAGYGRIGRETGRKATALGLRVLAADPLIDAESVRAGGAQPVEWECLLAESDFVSLHPSLGPGTRRMLDAGAIARMKPGSVLINVGRGGLVDEDALAAALHGGQLAGAGIDVVDPEPPASGAAILSAPNLIVTPHVAWFSIGARLELQRKAAEEVARVLRGEPPRFRATE
ncbi:MAG: C-terminal binding protein [Candidatus Dormibacteraceae bacterium]